MGRIRVPFADANGKQPSRKPRPQRKKRPKSGAGSSGWALAGVAISLAATWAFAALRLGRKARTERRSSKTLLQAMLLKPLLITEHGACRMDCRHISKSEVFETLSSGKINSRKSDPWEQPCPKYVVDARVGSQGKDVQAVFSACRDTTKLVTVIDKNYDWECYCP